MVNNRGLSLVESVVALGILSVVVLGVVTMLSHVFRSGATDRAHSVAGDFTAEFNRALVSSNRCTAVLGGQTSNLNTNITLNLGTGTLNAELPEQNRFDGLKLVSAMFTEKSVVDPIALPGEYQANLQVKFEKPESTYGTHIIEKNFVFFLTDDPSDGVNQIDSCSGISLKGTEIACLELGGFWDSNACNLSQLSCAEVGGNWVEGNCDLAQIICEKSGGIYVVGPPSACNLCDRFSLVWNAERQICENILVGPGTGGGGVPGGPEAVVDEPTTGVEEEGPVDDAFM